MTKLLQKIKNSLFETVYYVVYVGCYTRGAENIVAEAGTKVHLRCPINSTTKVHWDNYAQHNPTVYTGFMFIERLRHRYTIDISESSTDLIIRDVRLTDAGNYSCYKQSSRPRIVSYLIVVRSTFRTIFVT